ncbi:MAG: 50S ribosomal protein L21 [Spirochaetales bacterium]|jgi:large subunit ribosomal protein L21|nr:50S ribosomal protein L21 [Spirochaetales bacterium]
MYALVEIRGKQYKAEKGTVLKIDRLAEVKGETIDFDSVLLLRNEGELKVGTPYVEGASVKTTVEDHGKDKKIIIRKFKKRKNYRRKQGHRQQFTLVRVEDIVGA